MQRKNNDEAEEWLEKAQKIELPSDNEKAMVLLQLANIHANKGKWNNAKIHFRNGFQERSINACPLNEIIKKTL